MNGALPIVLQAPGWLLLLPLPWLLGRLAGLGGRLPSLPRRRPSRTAGEPNGFADPHLLEWLRIGPAQAPAAPLARLAWVLIVVAASGPTLPQAGDPPRRFGMDLAVVVDISPSMAADDVAPSRLKRAALELRDLAARLGDDRVALVVYSAYAYRLLPLTHDLELLTYYADALDPGLTRRHGSNLAQALEFAGRALGDDRARGRAVLVLSDGEAPDRAGAFAAADRLGQRGIPVFALGIGTAAGAPVPGTGGYLRTADGIAISRLDHALLAEVARRSGGEYVDTRADDGDRDLLLQALAPLRRASALPSQAVTGRALHPWLLAAAFALLLWGGLRRRHAAAPLCLLALTGIALPHVGHAAPWQEQAAYDALARGDHAAAATGYQRLDTYAGWLGRGAAYYRQQQWSQALAAFTAAVERAGDDGARAAALYNQGTALARLGRYAEAARAFERALQLQPNHARALRNLNLVRRMDTPLPAPAGARPRDAADPVSSAPAAERRDTAGGNGTAARSGTPAAGRGEAPEQELAHSLASLAARRDRPEEILRHRFMVQDVGRPLVAEEPSW